MSSHADQRLAKLIAALPPAPERLVRRAQDIPSDHPALGEFVVRAEDDPAFRAELERDPEAALERAGHPRDAATIQTLRGHLGLGRD